MARQTVREFRDHVRRRRRDEQQVCAIGEIDDALLRKSFELNFFAHQSVAQNAVRNTQEAWSSEHTQGGSQNVIFVGAGYLTQRELNRMGHDAWVIGDEPWVSVDWAGRRLFAASRRRPEAQHLDRQHALTERRHSRERGNDEHQHPLPPGEHDP